MDRQKDWQKDRQSYGQTYGWIERQMDREINCQRNIQMDRQRKGQTDRWMNMFTGKQTFKWACRQPEGMQADRQIKFGELFEIYILSLNDILKQSLVEFSHLSKQKKKVCFLPKKSLAFSSKATGCAFTKVFKNYFVT